MTSAALLVLAMLVITPALVNLVADLVERRHVARRRGRGAPTPRG
jgi:hypothetical protein